MTWSSVSAAPRAHRGVATVPAPHHPAPQASLLDDEARRLQLGEPLHMRRPVRPLQELVHVLLQQAHHPPSSRCVPPDGSALRDPTTRFEAVLVRGRTSASAVAGDRRPRPCVPAGANRLWHGPYGSRDLDSRPITHGHPRSARWGALPLELVAGSSAAAGGACAGAGSSWLGRPPGHGRQRTWGRATGMLGTWR